MRTFLRTLTAVLIVVAVGNLFIFMMVGFMNTMFISNAWCIGTTVTLSSAVLMTIIYSNLYNVKVI